MTSIETLMRDSNPMTDPSTEFSEEEIQAFDLLVQSRSGIVDVQELTKPVEPEKKQRSGWLVAAVAFAVVIVFVGAAMLLARPADELPPATTPPTTQVVTPTTQAVTTTVAASTGQSSVDPAALTFLEDYLDELNAGDIDAVSARFEIPTADGPQTGEVLEAAYGIAVDSTWELGECKLLTGGISRCEVSRLSPHEPWHPEAVRYSIAIRLEAGELVSYRTGSDDPDTTIIETRFASWMQENHPAEWSQLYLVGVTNSGLHNPRISDPQERAALRKQYVPLWRASLEG